MGKLFLAFLVVSGGGAYAVNMPMLTPVPFAPDVWVQSPDGRDLYINDAPYADNFFFAGIAMPPVGLDCYIDGRIQFNNRTELGFIQRADPGTARLYICSYDPTNGYFNLVKVKGFTGGDFVNLVNKKTGIIPAIGSEWEIAFSANTVGSDVRLDGWLYDNDGDLVSSFSYLDTGAGGLPPYLSGVLGTWSFQKSLYIEGTWTDMEVKVPEPATIGLMGLSIVGLMRRRWK